MLTYFAYYVYSYISRANSATPQPPSRWQQMSSCLH